MSLIRRDEYRSRRLRRRRPSRSRADKSSVGSPRFVIEELETRVLLHGGLDQQPFPLVAQGMPINLAVVAHLDQPLIAYSADAPTFGAATAETSGAGTPGAVLVPLPVLARSGAVMGQSVAPMVVLVEAPVTAPAHLMNWADAGDPTTTSGGGQTDPTSDTPGDGRFHS